MNPKKIIPFFLLALTLVLGCTFAADAAYARATVIMEPEDIALGEGAQMTLTVEGAPSVTEPQFPRIDGVQIIRVGKSTNFQIINGVFSGGVVITYNVIPQKVGVFTIPELSISTGREVIKTNPVVLRVTKPNQGFSGSVGSAAPGQLPPPAGQQAPSSMPQDASQPSELSSKLVVFQLNLPKRDFYVGEIVPAELKVYLRHGINVTYVLTPTLSGDAFLIGKFQTKPDKEEDQAIDNKLFKILTWHTSVAPVKAGEYPLGAQMDVIVEERVRARSPFGDDSLLDRFFGGTEKKQITLKSKETQVKTLSLPEEGRPSEFSGAIGQFELTAEATPHEVAAGDPVTLKMSIAGAGNFDRVKAPEFGKKLGFKTYPPSSKFEPFDSVGLGGRKVFDQMVIPQNDSVKAVPRITFSYFNPDNGKYVTLASNEIPLKVSGSTTAAPAPGPASASAPTAQSPAAFTASDAEVVANKLFRGGTKSTLVPVLVRPWFWILQTVPLAALITALTLFRRRDRFETDPVFARSVTASKAIQLQIDAMDKAIKEKNAHDFFFAARRVIQERLGERLGIKPETITPADLADMGERLRHGVNHGEEDPMRGVKSIFEVADAVTYSGQKYGSESLEDWKRKVLHSLKRLEKVS